MPGRPGSSMEAARMACMPRYARNASSIATLPKFRTSPINPPRGIVHNASDPSPPPPPPPLRHPRLTLYATHTFPTSNVRRGGGREWPKTVPLGGLMRKAGYFR
jgi:hypothetical protein